MQKLYTSLGLMSGTSGDGVDASIIQSNGIDQFEVIKNKFYEYDSNIYNKIHNLKEKISNISDLNKLSKDLKDLERQITLYHAKIIKDLDLNEKNLLLDFTAKQFIIIREIKFQCSLVMVNYYIN